MPARLTRLRVVQKAQTRFASSQVSSLSNDPVHPCVIPLRAATNVASSSGVQAPKGSHVTVKRVRLGPSSQNATAVSMDSGHVGDMG